MAETDLRLAPHFPRAVKQCRDVAQPFFACFSTKSKQPEGGVSVTLALRPRQCTCLFPVQDADAGRKALAMCADLMKPYDECMYKHAPQNQTLYRVPEAYRDRKE